MKHSQMFFHNRVIKFFVGCQPTETLLFPGLWLVVNTIYDNKCRHNTGQGQMYSS